MMGIYKRREVLFMILQQECQRLNRARESFRVAKHDYEEVDRQIAMDERTICKPCAAPKRKIKKPRDFSREEILQIAAKLNIVLKDV